MDLFFKTLPLKNGKGDTVGPNKFGKHLPQWIFAPHKFGKHLPQWIFAPQKFPTNIFIFHPNDIFFGPNEKKNYQNFSIFQFFDEIEKCWQKILFQAEAILAVPLSPTIAPVLVDGSTIRSRYGNIAISTVNLRMMRH